MRTRESKIKIIASVVIAAVLVIGIYLFIHRGEESTDDASISAHTVNLSPKVSGYVKELNINDNQLVKAGDVLLQIDPADYILRRDRAQGALDAAQAEVKSTQATLENAQSDLARMQRLSSAARSQEQLDQALSDEKSAEGHHDQILAQVKQSQADLSQAEKDLADTKVLAPIDGRITKRSVELGNYIQPGQTLASLVGTELWVVANYKETQIKHMRVGDEVDVSINAYPSVTLKGKVDSFQAGTGTFFSAFPPENATGNYVKIIQRVPVKIALNEAPSTKLHLGPGMSVVPIVHTGTGKEGK